MNLAKLGRIVRRACSWTIACAAGFAAVLVAAPSARAHGGVSIGIGFGFPAFIGAPVYAPPVYYVPPPIYYNAPYVGYYGPPPPYTEGAAIRTAANTAAKAVQLQARRTIRPSFAKFIRSPFPCHDLVA